MESTHTAEMLATDLKTAQDALREVCTILDRIHWSGENDVETVFYEIGRARGTARGALIMSGGR